MARAYLVEPQALFAPYFASVLASAGYAIVETSTRLDRGRVRASRPDVVVIDAGHLTAPLRTVRAIRDEHPATRIVIFAQRLDPMWGALATSVGADVVIGPYDDEPAFFAAVALATAA